MVIKNSSCAHNSPTRSVGENNIAFFSRPLCERYTSVFFPVTHRLAENGSLAAWKELKFDSFSMWRSTFCLYKVQNSPSWTDERLIVFIQNSPLKFPLITYGMMPSGHTRSGLEVAALLRRWRLRLPAALSMDVEPLTGTWGICICSNPFIWTR